MPPSYKVFQKKLLSGMSLGGYVNAFISKIRKHSMKDQAWILLLILVTLALRFPDLDHPKRPIMDERIHGAFALLSLNGKVYFDIHPPLTRIGFHEIASRTNFDHAAPGTYEQVGQGRSFVDFPYVSVRTLVAILGSTLPLLIYLLARMMGVTPVAAGLVALCIAIEPAFTLYSRTMLPDIPMIVFQFGALAAAYGAIKFRSSRWSFFLIVLSGLLIGAAISTKWIAVGVLGVIGLLLLWERKILAVIAITSISLIVYIASFFYFLGYFPQGGRTDPVLHTYQVDYVKDLTLPPHANLTERADYIIALHKAMWRSNTDEKVSALLPTDAPSPLAWPVAKVRLHAWPDKEISDQTKQVILQGNALLWTLLFFFFIFEILWIGFQTVHKRRWVIDRDETLLVVGYLANYLPFFLIERPMFLYHYFTALLFLLLLAPKVAPRVTRCLLLVTKDPHLTRIFTRTIIVLIILGSILSLPATYGI